MATRVTDKTLRTLYTRLAKLDLERKALISEIRRNPTHAKQYILDAINTMVKREQWFVKTGANGKQLAITDPDNVLTFIGGEVVKQYGDIVEVKVRAKNLKGAEYNIGISVSINRPIDAQLFQSVEALNAVQLRKIKREIEAISARAAEAKRAAEIEAEIAKLQSELKKLKK